MPLQILIADDHGVVRKGLRTLLESTRGWKVCAEATNGRKAVEEAGLCEAERHVPLNRLTFREREVIQLLTEGKSNKEVGAILEISVKTVESHRTRIMLKLGIHSITGLVRFAIRNKIIQG